jgi:hypothetical protein
MNRTVNAAFLLNLQLLDRVQVCDPKATRDCFLDHSPSRGAFPWWFYQGLRDDGFLALRSPSGFLSFVDPVHVVDVRRGELVRLRAMSHLTYLQHLSSRRSSQDRPDDALYLPASLLYVQKDRWGGIACYVDFDAKEHNKASFIAPLHEGDIKRVKALVSRRAMPVISPTAGNWSADFDDAAKASATRRTVRRSLAELGLHLHPG